VSKNIRRKRVPPPPDPVKRREPLPVQAPKPEAEDPGAGARINAIISSPTYLQADEDLAFIQSPAARGLRLQAEYLKTELQLDREGVRHTIVAFGGTRIKEPEAARRDVSALRAAAAAHPSDAELARRLAVAERVALKSPYYDVARELGRVVGRESARGLLVATGGGPGIMEAANRGAYDVSAKSIGFNVTLPLEQFPNPYITPELCFRFHYFALRKMHFLMRAKALVAFPGGYGTFDELFEALTLIQTRKIKPMPVVLVGESYWRKAFDADFLVAEGVIAPEDRELFWFAETADEIWSGIRDWYEANGETL
jgi:uncharacterized protein (TIGR00730 family)